MSVDEIIKAIASVRLTEKEVQELREVLSKIEEDLYNRLENPVDLSFKYRTKEDTYRG